MTSPAETAPLEVQTFYIVVIDKSGNPMLLTQMPSENITAEREANLIDVRRASSELLADIQTRGITDFVKSLLESPTSTTNSEQVKEALADRGIDLGAK